MVVERGFCPKKLRKRLALLLPVGKMRQQLEEAASGSLFGVKRRPTFVLTPFARHTKIIIMRPKIISRAYVQLTKFV